MSNSEDTSGVDAWLSQGKELLRTLEQREAALSEELSKVQNQLKTVRNQLGVKAPSGTPKVMIRPHIKEILLSLDGETISEADLLVAIEKSQQCLSVHRLSFRSSLPRDRNHSPQFFPFARQGEQDCGLALCREKRDRLWAPPRIVRSAGSGHPRLAGSTR